MRYLLLCCSLFFGANFFAQDDVPKDSSQNVRISLVSVRSSKARDLHIIAKFASLDGKQVKELPVFAQNGAIFNVIKSCVVSSDFEKGPLKLDLILSVPRNWTDPVPPNYSKWDIYSIDIHQASGIPVNLLDSITKPSDQQDVFVRECAKRLARNQVPTAEAADRLAIGVIIKNPGLGGNELTRVTGLYKVAGNLGEFAKDGDLVWEVCILRDLGISGVVWVSTTTKSVKVLFPFQL